MEAGWERTEAKLGFDKIRKALTERCNTDYAAARVASEAFCTDPAEIRRRISLTDEMRLVLMFEDRFPTTGYIDALPFLEPLEKEGTAIDVHSLGKLGTLLDTVLRIKNFLGSVKDGVYPGLKAMAKPIENFPEVRSRIDEILDRYGDVRDSASPELAQIRRSLHEKEASLSKTAAAILRKAQEDGFADKDASVAIRDGKFLIPVSTASKRKVQGFVFDESATGKTSYIEPAEVIGLENDIRELHFEETREIYRILREFTDFLRPCIPGISQGAKFIGEIDFLMAKASTALEQIAGMPVISEEGRVQLRKARHPLLEKALAKEGRKMVPLSIELDPGKRILLISGPNAGGKSVCLKTAGLLQYMFQWGMLVPTSESSELRVFRRILVSIGDDQSLENDLSTYSSFLADMKQMLEEADGDTLVLIDEFGSGTEPAAGGAIAEAILAELDRRGAYGVITTHYTNLKLYAATGGTGVVNGAMLFDAARIEPEFKLETGYPGNSFAFELARKMKLPETIVKDAEQRAGEEYVGIERNLRKIARGRRAIDERLQKLKATDKALEGLTQRYEKELQEVRQLRQAILDEARREAEKIVKGAGKQVEKTIRDIKEAQAGREETMQARRELQGFLAAIEQKKAGTGGDFLDRKMRQLESSRKKRPEAGNSDGNGAQADSGRRGKAGAATSSGEKNGVAGTGTPVTASAPLQIGEKVRIKASGMVGEVARVSSKSITVLVGNVSATIAPGKLERISSNEFRQAARASFTPPRAREDASIRERKLQFRPELDVRGARLSDAMEAVTRYIDDALMLGMGSVRIIHGKGTGVLHEEIQKYLRTVPGVASALDEDVRKGGSGVTIVNFE